VKPQFASNLLDEADASPHPTEMAKSETPSRPKPPPREDKLAQALRANLRRRKAKASGTADDGKAAADKAEGE
jgi:hypothetical protein